MGTVLTSRAGFSLIELMLAVAITTTVTASVFSILNPAQGAFEVQPEASDMQQRLRVGVDTLSKDLVMAGAGGYAGSQAGALNYFFAPILPFRQGAVGDAPAGTFATDTITVLYISSTAAQTTLKDDRLAGQTTLSVYKEGAVDCPLQADGTTDKLCRFRQGMQVLVYDTAGNYDTFTVTAANDEALTISVNLPAGAVQTAYKANNTKVVQVIQRTYYLKQDAANKLYQLVYYDGGTNGDIPVVDHVVGLKFDYYGDPQPPQARKPGQCDPNALTPCTTYGPAPNPAATVGSWPIGENCAFSNAGSPTPRLTVLGGDPTRLTPILLTAAQLTDGPWCPDVRNANRFDADLLRIRKIGVTLRVEAAVDSMRGPAGALFTRGGTAKDTTKLLPDLEIRFQVSPRNLNLGR